MRDGGWGMRDGGWGRPMRVADHFPFAGPSRIPHPASRFPAFPLPAHRLTPLAFPNAKPPRRNGQARVAVQAARLHLPILRDLRRYRIGLGLRSARRRAEEESQGTV